MGDTAKVSDRRTWINKQMNRWTQRQWGRKRGWVMWKRLVRPLLRDLWLCFSIFHGCGESRLHAQLTPQLFGLESLRGSYSISDVTSPSFSSSFFLLPPAPSFRPCSTFVARSPCAITCSSLILFLILVAAAHLFHCKQSSNHKLIIFWLWIIVTHDPWGQRWSFTSSHELVGRVGLRRPEWFMRVLRLWVLVQGQVYLLININNLLPGWCGGIQMAEFRCNPSLTCILPILMRNVSVSQLRTRTQSKGRSKYHQMWARWNNKPHIQTLFGDFLQLGKYPASVFHF